MKNGNSVTIPKMVGLELLSNFENTSPYSYPLIIIEQGTYPLGKDKTAYFGLTNIAYSRNGATRTYWIEVSSNGDVSVTGYNLNGAAVIGKRLTDENVPFALDMMYRIYT